MESNEEINRKSETEGLEFEVKPIQFFPEDLEKTKNMSEDEKLDFLAELKLKKRYIIVDDNKVTGK